MSATILLADDDHGIRRSCKELLETAGFRVVMAEDGVEAAELSNTIAVDLVILDEHMPRCTGMEAARILKAWHPDLPIVLFTGDAYHQRTGNSLVDAVVMKSEGLSALTSAIIPLLRRQLAAHLGRMKN